MKRKNATQEEKRIAFKTAFEIYNKYLAKKNYIGAYVVAFSILEDRITASYMLLCDKLKKQRPPESEFIPFAKKLNLLFGNGVISADDKAAYKNCGDERNEKFHAAMWNLNAITAQDCQTTFNLTRRADALSRKVKKSLK
jgi:hypothetical protein